MNTLARPWTSHLGSTDEIFRARQAKMRCGNGGELGGLGVDCCAGRSAARAPTLWGAGGRAATLPASRLNDKPACSVLGTSTRAGSDAPVVARTSWIYVFPSSLATPLSWGSVGVPKIGGFASSPLSEFAFFRGSGFVTHSLGRVVTPLDQFIGRSYTNLS